MNISTNSWHYKLVKNTFTTSKGVPKSLCPYFRAVMYRVIFFSAAAVGLTLMLGNMMLPAMIAWGATGIWAYVGSFFGSIIFLGAILGTGFSIIFGGTWLWQKVEEWRDDRKYAKQVKDEEDRAKGIEPEQPNIVFAFVKANHEKICPTLNFVEKETK